jgi:hypothetical protein
MRLSLGGVKFDHFSGAVFKQYLFTFYNWRNTMNFTLKTLVAAVALVAAGSANAAINNITSANGDLFLTLIDNTNKVSAVFDLGGSFSTLTDAKGQAQTWDLSADTSYTSFIANANLPTAHWALLTGKQVGGISITTTYNQATPAAETGTVLNNQTTNFGLFLARNTTLGGTLTTGGSNYVSGTTSITFAGASTAYGATGKINGAGSVTWGDIGSSMGVVNYSAANNKPVASAVTIFGNDALFNFSSKGVLSYTTTPIVAVPEADSYAMLLAGLAVVGAIARRRQAA